MEVDRPDVRAEIEKEFAGYELALAANDVEALDGYFWHDPRAVRYGTAENLYGFEEIAAFRAARAAPGARETLRQVITSFGDDFATTSIEFRREAPNGAPVSGRQSQTWARTADGWRIVAAHVSILPA